MATPYADDTRRHFRSSEASQLIEKGRYANENGQSRVYISKEDFEKIVGQNGESAAEYPAILREIDGIDIQLASIYKNSRGREAINRLLGGRLSSQGAEETFAASMAEDAPRVKEALMIAIQEAYRDYEDPIAEFLREAVQEIRSTSERHQSFKLYPQNSNEDGYVLDYNRVAYDAGYVLSGHLDQCRYLHKHLPPDIAKELLKNEMTSSWVKKQKNPNDRRVISLEQQSSIEEKGEKQGNSPELTKVPAEFCKKIFGEQDYRSFYAFYPYWEGKGIAFITALLQEDAGRSQEAYDALSVERKGNFDHWNTKSLSPEGCAPVNKKHFDAAVAQAILDTSTPGSDDGTVVIASQPLKTIIGAAARNRGLEEQEAFWGYTKKPRAENGRLTTTHMIFNKEVLVQDAARQGR